MLPAFYDRERLTGLRRLLEKWSAEYPAILATDPVRAAHHADALADLARLILKLEASQTEPQGREAYQRNTQKGDPELMM